MGYNESKLSSLVPDLIIVLLIVPLSNTSVLEPISTLFPISTAPFDPTNLQKFC